jgi:hypothetical protein
MSSFKRHPLVVFFVLAFALPWLVWSTAIGQAYGWLSFRLPQALAFWLGLTIATGLAAALTGGRVTIIDLMRRIVHWRVQPVWYVVDWDSQRF